MDDFEQRQGRGGAEAYERYLAGMDATMRQKVALTAAHLLCTGRVADMGMGSGAGSDALAALYPSLQVVGVDLDPQMVELARTKYRRPNLGFVLGDIADEVFPPESLDGILDSSVLHHVTSFGGYDAERARSAIRVQARALRRHGIMLLRDFLAPMDNPDVLLDLPADDGDASQDPRTCSSAALFERFAGEFRSLHEHCGFDYVRLPEPPLPGWVRYRVRHRHAIEFVLRKDYRNDWQSELKEEYTYFTQAEFESELARLGLRMLASTALRNPWIVEHRFEGKLRLRRTDGEAMPWPATNYLIAGEKVSLAEGVSFSAAVDLDPVNFLSMNYYRDKRTGSVRDLVRRPHLTVDVLPYFESDGILYAIARMSYPRPILSVRSAMVSLDESRAPHYVTEPLNVLQTDRSLGQTVEEMLNAHGRIRSDRLRRFRPGATYYPSPGGTQEEVRSVFVEIAPLLVEDDLPSLSGFSTSGLLRAIEADQVLRAAQVGALPDARLELNVYDLLLANGRRPSAWIGDEISLREVEGALCPTGDSELWTRRERRVFERVSSASSPAFLDLRCARFEERNARGDLVASGVLEYVQPRTHSANTIVCAVLAARGGAVYLGLDDDDLPAAQCFTGNSNLLVTPAWRLPREITTRGEAEAWATSRLRLEFGVEAGRFRSLGGSYFPSAGMSPELVYPVAVEIASVHPAPRTLHWVEIERLVRARERLQDGHLRIVVLRAAHALGRLDVDPKAL